MCVCVMYVYVYVHVEVYAYMRMCMCVYIFVCHLRELESSFACCTARVSRAISFAFLMVYFDRECMSRVIPHSCIGEDLD